jgi:hypothetical protein
MNPATMARGEILRGASFDSCTARQSGVPGVRRKETADPSTSFAARDAANFAQDDSIFAE